MKIYKYIKIKKNYLFSIFILIFQLYASEDSEEMIKDTNINYESKQEEKKYISDLTRYIYYNPDGLFGMGSCISKDEIQNYKGEMTDEEYIDYIISLLPPNSTKFRIIKQEDYPADNYFIDAWCDVTDEECIDIDCTKAKEIELGRLREKRQKSFEELGFPTRLHIELEKNMLSEGIRQQLQILRDITEPLKRLETTNRYNDENLLEEIKKLGAI